MFIIFFQVWTSSKKGPAETASYIEGSTEVWRALDYLDCVCKTFSWSNSCHFVVACISIFQPLTIRLLRTFYIVKTSIHYSLSTCVLQPRYRRFFCTYMRVYINWLEVTYDREQRECSNPTEVRWIWYISSQKDKVPSRTSYIMYPSAWIIMRSLAN